MPLPKSDIPLFPAHAGVILNGQNLDNESMAFPRPCGGDPIQSTENHNQNTLFPAHAGVILAQAVPETYRYAFPRPCGGDPYLSTSLH